MKLLNIVLIILYCLFTGRTQGNRVFSGGEIINYSIVDISTVGGIAWSTERAANPGYYSVVNNAIYIGCSDAENIDGYIKKYGNTNFIFPVGSGNDLRTLEISAPSDLTDAYATAWIIGNPSLNLDPTSPNEGPHSVYSYLGPIVAVSTTGQWDWQVGDAGNLGPGTTGTGVGLTITVSIPDLTTFAPASYLRLVGWNGIRWIDLSGKSTANGNTENSTLNGKMVAGITALAIGRIESALAIKLENFNAISSNCDAVLNWTSSNEINTELFIVEQSSDAVNFHSVSSVVASGLPNGNQYSITLAQPSGIVYYRLKIKDNDGAFTYSPIILCRNNCDVSDYMFVYPNPVSAFENINLSFASAYKGQADFILFNIIGQRILTKPISLSGTSNLISTDVTELTAGAYFIIVLNTEGKQIGTRQKFIRQ